MNDPSINNFSKQLIMDLLKRIFLFVISVFVLVSCKEYAFRDENVAHVSFEDFKKTETIKATNHGHPSSMILPLAMEINGDYLIVNDYENDSCLLHIFSLPEVNYLGAVGSCGRGNDELIGVWRIKAYKNSVYAYDLTSNKMLKYALDGLAKDSVSHEYFFDKGNILPRLLDFEFLGNNTIVGYTRNSDSILTYINIKEKKVFTEKGPYPLKFRKGFPKNVLNTLFRTSYDVNDDRIVATGFRTNFLQIFTRKGDLIKALYFPELDIPDFVVSPEGKYYCEKRKRTYLDVLASENCFYVLYFGSSNMQEYWSKEIFQFDMNGNPHKRYILDYNVAQFEYSSKHDLFYGISVNEETGVSDVISFKLE